MSDIMIGVTVFGIIFGAALLGMFLGKVLPNQHLTPEARDVIRIVMGMLATLSAVVLGLLTGSAISSLAEKEGELRNAGVQFIMLDRTLAAYGPETKAARDLLKQTLTRRISQIWPEEGGNVTLDALGGGANPGGSFPGAAHLLLGAPGAPAGVVLRPRSAGAAPRLALVRPADQPSGQPRREPLQRIAVHALLDHFGDEVEPVLDLRCHRLEVLASIRLGHRVIACALRDLLRMRHRLDALRIDRLQLLHQRKHALQLREHLFDLCIGHFDAGKLRNTLDVQQTKAHGR